MKKWYSTIMMFAMMVASLSLTSCGGDDDNGSGDEGDKRSMTLLIDGEKYYAVDCHAEQTNGRGMYFNIHAVTNADFPLKGDELVTHISSPNTVANLTEGQVFESNHIQIQTYRALNEIPIGTYNWNAINGNITIRKITNMELTIEINSLQIEHRRTGVKRTISGTAVLDSGVYSSDGDLLPFADAISNLSFDDWDV